jgi:hypothetical protein
MMVDKYSDFEYFDENGQGGKSCEMESVSDMNR